MDNALTDLKQGHTPGPWVYVDAEKEASMQFRKLCVIRGGGKEITSFSWQTPSKAFPSKEESQANARLIAAAPELLEALQGAIGALEQDVDTGADYNDADWSGIAQQRLDDARAAIARATGAA